MKLVEVPPARPGNRFTPLFEASVLALTESMPVVAVAHLVGEHDTRIWRVIHHYVGRVRDEVRCAGSASTRRA